MTQQEIENRFTYHKPIGNQPQRYEDLRNTAKRLAEQANLLCPESREKSHGMTQLEDAVMWFNASIARNENEATSTVPLVVPEAAGKSPKEVVEAVQEELRQLCYAIERMPASEQQTALSLEASNLTTSVYKIVQAMGV